VIARRRAALAAALAAAVAATAPATAGPADLKVRPGATPRSLKMRRAVRAAQTTPAPAPEPTTPPAAGTPTAGGTAPALGPAAPRTPTARDFDLGGVRRADEKVVFRLDLGLGVDGAALSGRRALSGEPLSADDFSELRAQGFGNLFVGTRGLGIAPLSSYISLGFRLTPSLDEIAPLADALDSTRDLQIRSGWAEATNFLPTKLLRAARVRAGRQYVYGPWPVHFDGVLAAWTSKALQVSVLGGQRVDDYAADDLDEETPPIAALIGAVDFGALGRWPITVRGTAMLMSDRRFGDLEIGYRPRRGLVVVAGARSIDSKAAQERATVRAQISEVTHLLLDVEHRHAADWRWDMSYIDPTEPGAARPYLELPETRPQLRGLFRAGTVLLDNVDLYGRAAAAIDLGDRADERTGYVEGGIAAEVRIQRAIAVSGSFLVRDYELTDSSVVGTLQTDVGNEAQPLFDPADDRQYSSSGEERFIEGGAGIRVSNGARRFSATGEFYGRSSKYALLYTEDTPTVGDIVDRYNRRYGGRFTVDGWLTPRLRLHLEYDVTLGGLDNAPEINGWKTLRLMAEGSF
jgi:hypothetical protein